MESYAFDEELVMHIRNIKPVQMISALRSYQHSWEEHNLANKETFMDIGNPIALKSTKNLEKNI